MRPWVAFFSQTGTEINNLSRELGLYPEAIITNRQDTNGVNSDLINTTAFRTHKLNRTIWHTLPQKPVLESYMEVLSKFSNPIITLHGYLRIIPKEICEKYEIYNLHPGLITRYPELKGFNPQERAFTQGYHTAGCVIHKVTPGVDEGPIVREGEISIDNLTLPEVYSDLHKLAFKLWKSFLTEDIAIV
ncbi:MAG: hypothetical protein EBU90_02620 [Proteobacteria bacterium]|nr:hypothetical protein [Pseudomonadota bacterium]NBP13130.1 hypothetical protein [bacterium]